MLAKCKICKIIKINKMRKCWSSENTFTVRTCLSELSEISDNAMLRARAARCMISTVHGDAARELNLMSFMAIVEGQSITLYQARQMLGTK